jgi:hypothetical protein
MEKFKIIQKSFKPAASQDYEFLRSEGLKHIENLASDIWTDYNAHDPGITILEALCYAITELGYRCGFDMTDLLHTEDGKLVNGQTLFTAKEILTINPLTVNDYRKLLVDIDGISNAWMITDNFSTDERKNKHAVNEVEIFADCRTDALTLKPNLNPLFLSGLYRVLLDLDFDNHFGDLNNGKIIAENPSSTNFHEGEFVFQVNLPSWKNADFDFAKAAQDADKIDTLSISQTGKVFTFSITLKDLRSIEFTASIPKKPASGEVTLASVQQMFDVTVPDKKEKVAGIFKAYFLKILKSKSIVQSAVKTLHEHRNLCEDFPEVTTIDDEEIAFCFDVDVDPGIDSEKVQAELFYAIENYLNPSVEFYSLRELLDKKMPVDEIFTGPILQHGFIDALQLEKTSLRSVIHASDVINLLMDIEGVRAIRNFLMTKYDSIGKAVPGSCSQKWCLEITPLHKPVLSTDKSKIVLFKNQFPFSAQYDEVRDTVLVLHAIRSRAKLSGMAQDLAVPAGKKRDTESYWPLQYDFPQTYGIGESGLPSGASDERIARQRQLKAYLMFYEQLLADFFSQLTQAHKLFSVEDIRQTYYAQFLNDIKDIGEVYNTSGLFGSLQNVLSNQDATADPKNGWQSLYENKNLFEDRRNRFLDHLLSRFAVSFNDYALLMYRINYDEKSEEKINFKDVSAAKINTLKNYPVISSERGKAFNFFPLKNDFSVDKTQLWDTENVSGLEKRISFLAGISDFSRRFLYCIRNEKIICTEKTVNENGEDVLKCFHSFSFTSPDGTKVKSMEYGSLKDALKAQQEAIELGADITNYLFDTVTSTFQVIGQSNEALLESEVTFAGKASAMAAAKQMAAEFKKKCSNPVGLHLIEHILLRPRKKNFDLMQVCLHNCECLCETDPYTFRISVVLPYDAGHFDNMNFRAYFEDKIREETPAHIMVKICWLNNDLMRQFEVAYKAWIETLAAYSFAPSNPNSGKFRKANNEMIRLLASLHSEYPQASLHDCHESKEGSNPVMLGKTVLGTFKSE